MKLYVAIQRFLNKNWVHYIVLFFILISIVAVIASSLEEMSRYRLALFGITYISSFVFLLEYAARILSAPALHPTKSAIKARLLYTFSFYGFVDFVAILPCVLTYIYWNTEVVHIIILPYIFIIFKLIRHSRSFRLIGKALYSVREELATAYTASFITICYLSHHSIGQIIGMHHLLGRCSHGSDSYRYHQFFLYEYDSEKRAAADAGRKKTRRKAARREAFQRLTPF